MDWKIAFQGCEVPIRADEPNDGPVVILAHGAGSHMDHRTVLWLSKIVRQAGGCVVRFNFMYRVNGRSMPDRMPVLISTYLRVIESTRAQLGPKRLVIGGHSMGGRVASMIEGEAPTADGLLLFGYPLHPAKQPNRLRDGHLASIQTRVLQINGTEDQLCTKEIMDGIASALDPHVWTLDWIEGADHSYAVKKSTGRSRSDVEAQIHGSVAAWLASLCLDG